MHLHLPMTNTKLPMDSRFGLFLLNINYWLCTIKLLFNVRWRQKPRRSKKKGLLVGGVMKYFGGLIVIQALLYSGVEMVFR
jgi:hypothetical protein